MGHHKLHMHLPDDYDSVERLNTDFTHELYLCPLCHEYFEFITNVHCQQKHGRTKQSIEDEYGPFKKGGLRKHGKQ